MALLRIILNGKKAGLPEVREAIASARENGTVEVRPTYEGGDVERLVKEAVQEGIKRIVAGGGDGTANEVVDAVMKCPEEDRPEIAMLPLGTANDFCTACQVPTDDLKAALNLAQTGSIYPVDVIQVNNDRYCINMATGGFGAQVTATTPVELKNFLGGGAYTVSGLVQALGFSPYAGVVSTVDGSSSEQIIVSAVCNGRQAGGGQQLAPTALIDDGLMDVVALRDFPPTKAHEVVNELLGNSQDPHWLIREQATSITWRSSKGSELPCNLDGEPIHAEELKFEVAPGAVKLVLPNDCPLLKANN